MNPAKKPGHAWNNRDYPALIGDLQGANAEQTPQIALSYRSTLSTSTIQWLGEVAFWAAALADS